MRRGRALAGVSPGHTAQAGPAPSGRFPWSHGAGGPGPQRVFSHGHTAQAGPAPQRAFPLGHAAPINLVLLERLFCPAVGLNEVIN